MVKPLFGESPMGASYNAPRGACESNRAGPSETRRIVEDHHCAM
jgi:hypothetical protein